MENENQGYWNLAGCGTLHLDDGSTYECGDGGGNVLFEDGAIYEDSGNGSMHYMGTVIPEDVEMFTGLPITALMR